MTDELPPDLMAYIDRFDGAEYGLVMIAIKRYAAAAVARERERLDGPIYQALDALCDVVFALPQESKTAETARLAELALRAACRG